MDRCGADLASITEKIDTTSGMGRFFFRLMASLGELERDQVSERTKAAMAHKRAQGQRISRFIPYGYRLGKDGTTLAKQAGEQRVVKRIIQLRENGNSYNGIAAELNRSKLKSRSGGKWYANTIMDIYKREISKAPAVA